MGWNLKLSWPSCDESKDGKKNRGLRSKPSYSHGCLAKEWMDLKEFTIAKAIQINLMWTFPCVLLNYSCYPDLSIYK